MQQLIFTEGNSEVVPGTSKEVGLGLTGASRADGIALKDDFMQTLW